MSIFLFAQLEIHDRETYNRYMEAATPIFIREGVKIHAADDTPKSSSPEGHPDKVVLLEFRDDAHMKSFFALPDYIEAGKARDAGAILTTVKFERFKGF